MPKTLAQQMAELVAWVKVRHRELQDVSGDMHGQMCHDAASHFRLYESLKHGDAFPLWLCRVVEGVMRDLDELPDGGVDLNPFMGAVDPPPPDRSPYPAGTEFDAKLKQHIDNAVPAWRPRRPRRRS